MKEPSNSQVLTADPGRPRKKKKGGLSFSTSKQRRRRELRKKEQTCTEGSEPPTDLSKTGGEVEIGAYSRNEELNPINEEREDSGSREPTMAESNHRSNSNKSGSEEEPKEDSISTVSLGCGFYALGSDTYLGYFKNGMRR
jgi:hypothetical protein